GAGRRGERAHGDHTQRRHGDTQPDPATLHGRLLPIQWHPSAVSVRRRSGASALGAAGVRETTSATLRAPGARSSGPAPGPRSAGAGRAATQSPRASARSRPPPDDATPVDAIGAALEAAAGVLQERRAFARQRQAIIAASPELQERERTKLA